MAALTLINPTALKTSHPRQVNVSDPRSYVIDGREVVSQMRERFSQGQGVSAEQQQIVDLRNTATQKKTATSNVKENGKSADALISKKKQELDQRRWAEIRMENGAAGSFERAHKRFVERLRQYVEELTQQGYKVDPQLKVDLISATPGTMSPA